MSPHPPRPNDALADLMRLIQDAPRVTWTKPEGGANSYLCLHELAYAAWLERWPGPETAAVRACPPGCRTVSGRVNANYCRDCRAKL